MTAERRHAPIAASDIPARLAALEAKRSDVAHRLHGAQSPVEALALASYRSTLDGAITELRGRLARERAVGESL